MVADAAKAQLIAKKADAAKRSNFVQDRDLRFSVAADVTVLSSNRMFRFPISDFPCRVAFRIFNASFSLPFYYKTPLSHI